MAVCLFLCAAAYFPLTKVSKPEITARSPGYIIPQSEADSYFRSRRIGVLRDGMLYYLAGDHLGTTSLVEDANGNKVAESRYYPYGGERWSWVVGGGAFPTDYRFTGQRLDDSIKLYAMGIRQYDPALGRWLSPDTLVPDPNDPQSLNRFSWFRNNPLKFIDPTGHKEEGECGPGDTCSDDPPPDLPDWLLKLLSDPAFLEWLAGQVDSWAWDVPSAVGCYGDVSGSLGMIVEGELNAQVSLMFNWRSGELTFLYGPGAGAYLGTPRGGSISASGGGVYTFGASRNEYLKGVDVYYGGTVGADAFAELGVKMVGSTSLDYVDVNGNGKLDLDDAPTLFVDPNSGRHVTSLQVGMSAGVNGAPNGVEVGGVGGLSATSGFNIISGWDWKGWPWNWWR